MKLKEKREQTGNGNYSGLAIIKYLFLKTTNQLWNKCSLSRMRRVNNSRILNNQASKEKQLLQNKSLKKKQIKMKKIQIEKGMCQKQMKIYQSVMKNLLAKVCFKLILKLKEIFKLVQLNKRKVILRVHIILCRR